MTALLPILLVAALTACDRPGGEGVEAARETPTALEASAQVSSQAKRSPASEAAEPTPVSADCGRYRAEAAGPDDILGLKVGMSLEEIRARLACSTDGFIVTESERTMRNGPAQGAKLVVLEAKVPQPRPSLKDFARTELKVTFARTPQQIAVVQIDRWAYYKGAARPALVAYRAEVESKYAGITFDKVGTAYPLGVLALTVDGQRLSAANRLRRTCIGTGAWQHNLKLSPLCGSAFAIQIYVDRDDPNYVSSIQSTLSNPSFSATTLEASRQSAAEEAQRRLDESVANSPKADL